MKKTHIQLICVLLMLCLLIGLMSACGNGSAPAVDKPPQTEGTAAANDAAAAELPHYKIGLIAHTNAGSWWDRIYDATLALANEFNCELVTAVAEDGDAAIAATENLCASGVNGIIHLSTSGITPRLVEICEANGAYLVATYGDCSDDAGFDTITSNPYWAGDVYADDYATAYALAEDMISNGAKNFVIFGMPPGIASVFDMRSSGATDAVLAAGLEPPAEVRSFALTEIANTLFAQYPDTDAIFSTVGSTSYITNPIMSKGLANKIQVSSYNDEGETADAFDAGILTQATEGNNAHTQLCFALLYNAITGNRISNQDGTAAHILAPYNLMYSSDDYKVFIKASTGGNYPYTIDEIKNLIASYNPEVSVTDFQTLGSLYSTEYLAEKYK